MRTFASIILLLAAQGFETHAALALGAAELAASEALIAAGAQVPMFKSKSKGKAAQVSRVMVSGCPKVEPSKWAGLLLLNQPVEHDFRFGPKCDLDGHVTFRRAGFPMDLRVRNLPGGGDRLKGRVAIDAMPDLQGGVVRVHLDLPEVALFQGEKEQLAGSSAYDFTLDLAGEPRENRGGTLKLSRFKGAAAKGSVAYKWKQR